MKKIILVMVSLFVLSCATENKQEDVVRELAKKDAIEKLQLPGGTKFSDKNIEVTEAKTESSGEPAMLNPSGTEATSA